MSSQYNNNIAQAIDILLNKRLSQLGYDQTIIAEIYEVVDSAKGKYKIQYESVVFDAESADSSKTYKLNRSVYVKVPKSDFSQKLLIESAVDSDFTLTGATLKELKEYKIPITPSFEYDDTFSLVAGSNESQQITKNYFESYENEKELQFKTLAKEYEVLKLEATFYNSLIKVHTSGNYGLKFNFITSEVNEKEAIKSYILDTSNFSGNIYSYNTSGSNQFVYYQVPAGTLKALKSITFFQENMEQDKNLNIPIMQDGKIVDYEKVTSNNLSASNIKITFYQVADLTEENMYLHLLAPKGYYGDELSFEAQLLNQGENIINESEYSTYWYKKVADSSQKTLAGQGWEVQTEVSATTFTLNNITTIDIYKVMVVNTNQEVVAEKEFNVSPSLEAALPSIIPTSGAGWVQLTLPEGYSAQWIVDNEDKGKSNSITLTLIDFKTSSIKIDYTIYQNAEEIGTSYMYLSAPAQEEDIVVNFSGVDWYQYDVNGDIYLEDAKTEKQMLVATTFGEGIYNTTEKQNFYIGDFQITDNKDDWQKYENTNSLLENVYYTQSETNNWIINYTINSKYNFEKNNNVLRYELILANGDIREFTKEITFSKVGDLGVNGTSYSCRLSSEVAYFNVFNPKDYVLNIEVYENGERITNTNSDDYAIKKLVFNNENEEIDCSNNITYQQQVIIPATSIEPDNINYVVLTIQINGSQITTYFGIPIGKNPSFSTFNPPTKYVRYNSEGKNPSYQYSDNNPNISKQFDYKAANGNTFYFKTHTINNISYPIVYFLNSFGNFTINNWDGNLLIDEKNNTVLANQIVAGSRSITAEGAPNFTGVIMGEVQDDTGKTKGIYGYKNNQNTFGLKEDGTAYFGSGAGRISFDGNEATIKGGGVDLDGDGVADIEYSMLIDLNSGNNKEAIILKQNNNQIFLLDYDGNIKLNSQKNLILENKTLENIITGLEKKIKELEETIEDHKTRIKALEGTGNSGS